MLTDLDFGCAITINLHFNINKIVVAFVCKTKKNITSHLSGYQRHCAFILSVVFFSASKWCFFNCQMSHLRTTIFNDNNFLLLLLIGYIFIGLLIITKYDFNSLVATDSTQKKIRLHFLHNQKSHNKNEKRCMKFYGKNG